MTFLVGPFVAVCLLLAVAGAMKVIDSGATVDALRATGLRAGTAAVRALGAAELAVGAGAAATGWPGLAAAVAVFYTAFAAFVVAARRQPGPLQSCGCFGTAGAPPTAAHLVVNLVAVAIAAAASVSRTPGLVDAAAPALHAALALALAAIGYVVLTRPARIVSPR